MKAVTAKHLTSDIGDFGSDLDASSLSAGTNFVGLTLNGGAGNDFLGGGAGDDILNGFDGDDILVGGAGADVLNGGSGNDTASYENASGGVIANLTNTANDYGDAAGDTYHGIENLRGSAFGDLLVGTDADDNVIEGGGGADVMIGGLGSDTASYEHAAIGVIANLTDNANNYGDATGDAYGGIENLRGSRFGDLLVGTDDTNGTDGANIIEGGGGADIMIGGLGSDTLSYEHANSGVFVNLTTNMGGVGDAEGDVFGGFENIRGGRFEDVLLGDEGDNILEGGAGRDVLNGGIGGDDTASYEHAKEGVRASLAESSINQGDAAGDSYIGIGSLRGSSFVDFLFGDGKNNTLEGGAGLFDFLDGGDGFDVASYEHARAGVTANLSNNLFNTGDADSDEYVNIEGLRGSNFGDRLTGDLGDNILDGGAGNDILEGGTGGDLLIGGDGNDTASYATATTGIVASLTTPIGNTGDAAGDSYDSIENLTGSAFDDTLIGNGTFFFPVANILDGGAGNDTLIGGSGGDRLIGGTGIDTASYANASGGVIANLSAPVFGFHAGDASGDTYSSIENLTGSAFGDVLTGDGAVNKLDGGAGDDVLEGGGGADSLYGSGGNDTASYAHASASVFANLTNSAFNTGDAAGDIYNSIQNLIGSAFDDVLVGDNGDNIIEGGAGADALIGGGGVDTASYADATAFVFVSLSDPVNGNGGTDAIGDSYNSIENVIGSAFGDFLSGDSGNNVLEGGGGADTLVGGAGTDTASYVHASAGVRANLANSSANSGEASFDAYTGIENLTGSAFNDTLVGDAGDNALDGGKGNDTLTGGAGNDTFAFRAGFGHDDVTDFVAGQDAIELHDGLFANANAALAAAAQTGSDVTITVDVATSIVLHNVALANLHASDFHVV